jgi:hypothetical protein
MCFNVTANVSFILIFPFVIIIIVIIFIGTTTLADHSGRAV